MPDFTAVYFLPLDNMVPSAIVVHWMVAKPDIKDGDKVRFYPKKEVTGIGYNSGVWGKNVAGFKIEIAAWALGYTEEGIDNAKKLLQGLEEVSSAWSEFIQDQVA